MKTLSNSTDDNELARYLASYLYQYFGTKRPRFPGTEYLGCTDQEDLYEAIKKFYDELP
jgi:hypothetical protein